MDKTRTMHTYIVLGELKGTGKKSGWNENISSMHYQLSSCNFFQSERQKHGNNESTPQGLRDKMSDKKVKFPKWK